MASKTPSGPRQRAIQRGLARAIAAGDLRLEYQPQVHLATGAIVGMEALCRWTDPQLGPMAPDEFIGVAEASGQILSLGRWVLGQALLDMPKILALHPGIRIAVNVSMHELVHEKFWLWLNGLLDETDAASTNHLEIELTETMFADQPVQLAHHLAALQQRGLSVALDDFGTGYSTLARLYTLPIDKIKLDKQFVQGLQVPQGQAIVKAMCDLAKTLSTTLVVEGVETPAQRELLISLGCETAQGYLTGAPAPLTHWLQT